jgi:hypothetical protein
MYDDLYLVFASFDFIGRVDSLVGAYIPLWSVP